MADTKAPEVAYAKKLGTADIIGKTASARLIPEGQTQRDLYTVLGIARTVSMKPNKLNGEMTPQFVGDFEASSLVHANTVRTTRIFLPSIVADQLGNAIAQAGPGGVQVAVIVGIKEDTKSSVGFVYYVKPLLKMTGDVDPLAEMKKALGDKLPAHKALPQPAKN